MLPPHTPPPQPSPPTAHLPQPSPPPPHPLLFHPQTHLFIDRHQPRPVLLLHIPSCSSLPPTRAPADRAERKNNKDDPARATMPWPPHALCCPHPPHPTASLKDPADRADRALQQGRPRPRRRARLPCEEKVRVCVRNRRVRRVGGGSGWVGAGGVRGGVFGGHPHTQLHTKPIAPTPST
jgi:hypothetical protein